MGTKRMQQGDRVWVSGDSKELGIDDYNVRVSSGATVVQTPKKRSKKVLLSVDTIDGDENVYCSAIISKLKILADPFSGNDAVFLPGKIHGCNWQLYVIYYNPDAEGGRGCFEIEILDSEGILKAYDMAQGEPYKFFDILPDMYHGRWLYCTRNMADFKDLCQSYQEGHFIQGIHGGHDDEMQFLVKWARAQVWQRKEKKHMPSKNVSYSCNICGQRFKTFEDAEKCENGHLIPESVAKPEYESQDRKSDYPVSVLVSFKGGKSARYYRK